MTVQINDDGNNKRYLFDISDDTLPRHIVWRGRVFEQWYSEWCSQYTDIYQPVEFITLPNDIGEALYDSSKPT